MKRNKSLGILFAVVAVACIVLMFFFSNQDGATSHGLSGMFIYRILDLLSIDSTKTIKAVDLCDFAIRKLAHLTEYAVLGAGLCGLLRILIKRYWGIVAIAIGAVLAALDEFHQSFTPGRTACVSDVVIDTLGVLVGCMTFASVLLILEHRYKNLHRK